MSFFLYAVADICSVYMCAVTSIQHTKLGLHFQYLTYTIIQVLYIALTALHRLFQTINRSNDITGLQQNIYTCLVCCQCNISRLHILAHTLHGQGIGHYHAVKTQLFFQKTSHDRVGDGRYSTIQCWDMQVSHHHHLDAFFYLITEWIQLHRIQTLATEWQYGQTFV